MSNRRQETTTGKTVRFDTAIAPSGETGPTVVVLKIHRKQQVKAAILQEYFRAAERGKISFIKFYRIRAGLDQTELARRARMTQSMVARAERPGHARNMKGFTLKKLAVALGVKVDELI